MIDANIVMAIILNEPAKPKIIEATGDVLLVSPEIIRHEVVNALSSLYRRKKLTKEQVVGAYSKVSLLPIRLEKVDLRQSLQIICEYAIYAYDSYYLELAQRLKLKLLTLDTAMRNIGYDMKITMMEL
ncbi:MAG: type II toxin-antitoxin system VapC family toxin [Treponemataceae bacterium]|nr:MAG: type II toxin-antitoxin system VapC family toxin [Treponemataceae bacterium]